MKSKEEIFDIILHDLGKSGERLQIAELECLYRIFMEAGRVAVLGYAGSPRQTVLTIEFANRLISRARKQQAEHTPTGSPDVLLQSDWLQAERISKENHAWLAEYPGVIGFGPGYKVKNGVNTGRTCLQIFVQKKIKENELDLTLPLPQQIYGSHGLSVETDVIELGDFTEQASVKVGDSCSPDHADLIGTIGAFATDILTKQPVAITAMHVTGLTGRYPEAYAPSHSFTFTAPSRHYPYHKYLGKLIKGRSRQAGTGVDSASIAVENRRVFELAHPRLGYIKNWRPVNDGDKDTPVRMYGNTSRYREGTIVVPYVRLERFGLFSAILVDIETREGDSGAGLVDGDGYLLGILSGRVNAGDSYFKNRNITDLAVFCTMGSVLTSLECEM